MSQLPADTRLGAVRLRVADLERQVAFYQDLLGLRIRTEGGGEVVLGSGEDGVLVVLEEEVGAPPSPPGSVGLFHMAFLLPDRAQLAAIVRRLGERDWPFQGFADHAVSEAAYLADPEGNGIELYADRPRELWRVRDGEIHIVTHPLDLDGLLAEAAGPSEELPERTSVGHVHLRVASLEEAEATYVQRIGFDVMVRSYPGALFVGAGGYHHHMGLNVWSSRGGPRPPEGCRGLIEFELVIPRVEARRRVLEGGDEGVLEGAAGETVRILGPKA